MPKRTRPRRGSLQYWPRKRASRIYASMDGNSGFAAFKAGMTHVLTVDSNSKSPTYGKLVTKPATILDAPSLFVLGIRFYKKTSSGLKCIGEKWADDIPKDTEIKRKTLPGKGKEIVPIALQSHKFLENQGFSESRRSGASPQMSDSLESDKTDAYDESRLIVMTQPKKSGMHKKKPDIFEMNVEGDGKKKLDLIGKELSAKDVFKTGEYVDVTAITKGHGFTGPVKRFGIRIQGRKDKQMHRHVGSIGGTTPRVVSWRNPAAGQYGFFRRTEFTKRILMIDSDASKVNAKNGLLGYGLVKSDFILVEGSVPGGAKRLVMLKKTQRPKAAIPVDIRSISSSSRQSV